MREFIKTEASNNGMGSSGATIVPIDTLIIEVEVKITEEIARFFIVELQEFEYAMEMVKTSTIVENALA